MFAETNHPGADIQIRDAKTHAVIGEYQLKAVAGAEPIHTHLHKYPDTPVYATDEVIQKFFLTHKSKAAALKMKCSRPECTTTLIQLPIIL